MHHVLLCCPSSKPVQPTFSSASEIRHCNIAKFTIPPQNNLAMATTSTEMLDWPKYDCTDIWEYKRVENLSVRFVEQFVYTDAASE
jgi:hypothetical protein